MKPKSGILTKTETADGMDTHIAFIEQLGELERMAHWVGFNANRMATLLGISVRQLERAFQSRLARSPHEWLIDLKLKYACQLLRDLRSVSKVSYFLGYKQDSHFCRQFKRLYGVPPSEYVKLKKTHSVGF